MSIEEFIEARIAEREAGARAAIESLRRDTFDGGIVYTGPDLGSWEVEPNTLGSGVRSAPLIVEEIGMNNRWSGCRTVISSGDGEPPTAVSEHIADNDPDTVLRECAHIRMLLSRYAQAEHDSCLSDRDAGFEAGLYAALESIASIWREHPDYQQY